MIAPPVPPTELPKLVFEKDLEEFEGPLLSLFRDESGRPWLYSWVDMNKDEGHRWLVFRVAPSDLRDYLGSKSTLRRLMLDCPEQLLHCVDVVGDGVELLRGSFPATALPDDYLPGEESFFDPEACP